MKIGINSTFRRFTACGHGRYLIGLLSALRSIDSPYQFVEYAPPVSELWNYARVRKTLAEARWELLDVSVIAAQHRIDILHNPYWTSPLLPFPRVVVTVHDVVPILPIFTAYRRNIKSWAYYQLISQTTRFASAVIADTQAAASDIQKFLGIDPRKVHVIPLAADQRFYSNRDVTTINRFCQQFGIDRPYILYVASGFDYRKNIFRTIEAFQKASSTFKSKNVMLVIAGDLRNLEYPASDDPRPLVAEKKLNDVVKFTGYIRDEDMPSLYQGADLCVFPSLYEGGGLAMLEAMVSGRAVLASDVPTLREMAGEAVEFVDPTNPDQIAIKMQQLMLDHGLRDELGQKAKERSQQFSWERTARETIEVYRNVLGHA